ncbi:hypothetical protein GZ78_19140 [Endozoicomonas numazuensis]|uniref:Uncharacterized protein n=2 Tax=Endozoicomonas numazuensis TaxID=1137799 RepID=A0A081NEC4_9GAMM|nr:hypothetical protein GZ78_19140 [Endozoicomonas numazuensis]
MQLRLGIALFLTSALFSFLAVGSGTIPEVATKKLSEPPSLINTSHCPSPADIVFNHANGYWQAPLTPGMPSSWVRMRSDSPHQAPETKMTIIFEQASLIKEEGLYYLTCHYQVADLARESSYKIILEVERSVLLNGTLSLPIITAAGIWEGEATKNNIGLIVEPILKSVNSEFHSC